MKSAHGLIILAFALGVAAIRGAIAEPADGGSPAKAKVQPAGGNRASGQASRAEVTKTISGTVVDEAGIRLAMCSSVICPGRSMVAKWRNPMRLGTSTWKCLWIRLTLT